MSSRSLSIENEKLMLQTCMGIGPSETLFILHTPGRKSEALRFFEAAKTLGVRATYEPIAETVQKSDKLPNPILEGFLRGSVILLLVSPIQNQIFGHHPVKDQAVERGARVGFVTIPIGTYDPKKTERIAHVSRSMGQWLSEAKQARLTSSLGTDVRLDLTGRKAVVFTNFLREPGAWGALPDYAEAAIPPLEGSAQGVLIVDGTMIGVGLLPRPVRFDIEAGKIVRFDGARESVAFKSLLEKGEGEIFGIAELGLGVNEFVTEFDGGFEDKKILGSAHLGIGGNLDLGGRLASTVHLDVILRKVSLELDGKWLLQDGVLVQKI
jgi:hypothetical protein